MAHSPLDHVIDQPWIGPVTKYQILLVASAAIVAGIYIPLARKIATGAPPRGRFWNMFEGLLLYVRDEIAKPNIHGSDAIKFTPFLWTLFLFILVCNLIGAIPFLGSPTASISVTTVLAVFSFVVVHGAALVKNGPIKYAKLYVPHMHADHPVVNVLLKVLILPLIVLIELMGMLIRSAVLAIRLFANLFAGHYALAVMIGLVGAALGSVWYIAGVGSVLAVVLSTGFSLLEILVAFIQAYVFTLLTAVFLGMALHPEH